MMTCPHLGDKRSSTSEFPSKVNKKKGKTSVVDESFVDVNSMMCQMMSKQPKEANNFANDPYYFTASLDLV